jgi:hypothetical protein
MSHVDPLCWRPDRLRRHTGVSLPFPGAAAMYQTRSRLRRPQPPASTRSSAASSVGPGGNRMRKCSSRAARTAFTPASGSAPWFHRASTR